jgi:hypothetical protein
MKAVEGSLVNFNLCGDDDDDDDVYLRLQKNSFPRLYALRLTHKTSQRHK